MAVGCSYYAIQRYDKRLKMWQTIQDKIRVMRESEAVEKYKLLVSSMGKDSSYRLVELKVIEQDNNVN